MNIKLIEINSYAYKIRDWEINAGSTFIDRYMHDYTDYKQWANYLIEKGYVKLGSLILEWENNDDLYRQDQNTLFLVHSGTLKYSNEHDIWYFDEDDYECKGEWDDLYMDDMRMMAKFILSTPEQKEEFDEWYERNAG